MDKVLTEEIMACLPEGRTLFEYFKDRYAVILLAYAVGEGKTVAECKQSHYGRLLEKPAIKNFLATVGNGWLNHHLLNNVWQTPLLNFVLTLGTWGNEKYNSYYQTSRAGHNLVLQLNFSNEHAQQYKQLVKPAPGETLNYYNHPVLKKRDSLFFRDTLAWARIDLDFSANQVLIEEIQCDWLREAKNLLNQVVTKEKDRWYWDIDATPEEVERYVHQVLQPYIQLWDEAMLAATIHFIRQELGIHHIFYHSYETGAMVKSCDPPRSLYTQLPRKFCFQKTEEVPEFLQTDKHFRRIFKKVKNPYWYKLVL